VLPALDDPDVSLHGEGTHRGRFDGRLEVACYCGRRTVLMSADEVARGIEPPPCTARICRSWSEDQ